MQTRIDSAILWRLICFARVARFTIWRKCWAILLKPLSDITRLSYRRCANEYAAFWKAETD
jgi:hypothetical protein